MCRIISGLLLASGRVQDVDKQISYGLNSSQQSASVLACTGTICYSSNDHLPITARKMWANYWKTGLCGPFVPLLARAVGWIHSGPFRHSHPRHVPVETARRLHKLA